MHLVKHTHRQHCARSLALDAAKGRKALALPQQQQQQITTRPHRINALNGLDRLVVGRQIKKKASYNVKRGQSSAGVRVYSRADEHTRHLMLSNHYYSSILLLLLNHRFPSLYVMSLSSPSDSFNKIHFFHCFKSKLL